MKLPKRDLLFDPEPAELKDPAPEDDWIGQRWVSVYAIPPRTLVKPSMMTNGNLLYVTSRGNGWWCRPDNAETEIELIETNNRGWTINQDEAGLGPFTEVRLP